MADTDLVDIANELVRLHGQLRTAITEPGDAPMRARPSGKPGSRYPAGMNVPALELCSDIEAGVRQREADLRDWMGQHTATRGDSDRDTDSAILGLPGLIDSAGGPGTPRARLAAAELRRWRRQAQIVLGDDHWRHLPGRVCAHCGRGNIRYRRPKDHQWNDDAAVDVKCCVEHGEELDDPKDRRPPCRDPETGKPWEVQLRGRELVRFEPIDDTG